VLNARFQEQPQAALPAPHRQDVPSIPSTGQEGRLWGGLLSDAEPELNRVPRHPKLLKPDKKKRRRRYGRQD
jgi:hypothetical protein